MKKVLLAGYFGCENLGDDAILLGFIEGIRQAGLEPTVLSGAPEETYRLYGLSSIPRKDMARFRQAMSEHHALVFPGGSIFQDVTSVKSAMFYANLVREAKKLNKKVALLSQGVGPLSSFLGKRAAKFAFESADAITVRDPESIRTLQSLGIKATPRATSDMAFLLPTVTGEEGGFQVGSMKSVGLIPRPHGRPQEVERLFADLSRLLFENGYMPTLIELDRQLDGPLIQSIEKAQGGKIPSLRKLTTPMELQKRLLRMDGVISMRLHGGIIATTVGVPSVMLSYDPKVSAFASEAGLPGALPMNSLTASRVFDVFQTMMKQRDQVAEKLVARREVLRQQAMLNIEVLQNCVR
ncbi:MAG: polysaccharide pyruvyl transferase CsaB [Chthonomonas sp.]|nr:polysaccharide pyruvyl transferase CsaB [Chthonomonas sp.]